MVTIIQYKINMATYQQTIFFATMLIYKPRSNCWVLIPLLKHGVKNHLRIPFFCLPGQTAEAGVNYQKYSLSTAEIYPPYLSEIKNYFRIASRAMIQISNISFDD